MKKLFEQLLDLIYKKKCYFCGKSKDSVTMCSECFEKLEYSEYQPNRIIEGVNIFCAGIYTKELQKLIRGVKYHRQKELAYYQAKFMYEYWQEINNLKNEEYLLVPVPLHANRTKKRKYNHMELVCEEFSKLTGIEYNFKLIKRTKDTKPQYHLNRTQRIQNLCNAFEIDESELPSKHILVMDDICTTGTTFEEIIKTFKKVGIKDITCFATATPES